MNPFLVKLNDRHGPPQWKPMFLIDNFDIFEKYPMLAKI